MKLSKLFASAMFVLGMATVVYAQGPDRGGLVPTSPSNSINADTTTVLAASATYTGSTRDVWAAFGTKQLFGYFNAYFFSDQTGTASIQCSNDNVNWNTCASATLAASSPLILSVPVVFRYNRVKLVNGSTLQGSLAINDSYTAG